MDNRNFIITEHIIAEVEFICEAYGWDFFCDFIISRHETFLGYCVEKNVFTVDPRADYAIIWV